MITHASVGLLRDTRELSILTNIRITANSVWGVQGYQGFSNTTKHSDYSE